MEITTFYEVVVKLTRDKVGFDKWKPMLNIELHVPGLVLSALHLLTGVLILILVMGTLRSEGKEVARSHS